MRKLFLILSLLLLIPMLAKADSQTLVPPNPQPAASSQLSIFDALKTLPLKEGVMYDFKNSRVLNTLSLGVVNYAHVGLDLSYIGSDGIGATLEYSLSGLPIANIPILNYLAYLNIGYSVGYRTLALGDVAENPKSDNQFIQGPCVFIKFKF